MNPYTVYIHLCPNGKYYIGCTHRKYPDYRWGIGGKHYASNPKFYSAILKYGWNSILHYVCYLDSKSKMMALESTLIYFTKSYTSECGYNRKYNKSLIDHHLIRKYKSQFVLYTPGKHIAPKRNTTIIERPNIVNNINTNTNVSQSIFANSLGRIIFIILCGATIFSFGVLIGGLFL